MFLVFIELLEYFDAIVKCSVRPNLVVGDHTRTNSLPFVDKQC